MEPLIETLTETAVDAAALRSTTSTLPNQQRLSVIIPLGPQEPEWPALLYQCHLLPQGSEVIIVGTQDKQPPPQLEQLPEPLQHLTWHWCKAEQGRAKQMNTGAQQATGDFLWFLHADTLLRPHNIQSLLYAITQNPEELFYFDLWFYDKTSRWLNLNERGAKFRSNVLGCPYGDQGLCIAKERFIALGSYPANTRYGEDHVFVWKARQQGTRLQPCGTQLGTSARKYQDVGWLKLTMTYQLLWLKQALPELLRWLRGK